MRKTRVLAVLIGLVLVAMLFLAWMLTTRRNGPVMTAPGSSQNTGDRAVELGGDANLAPADAQSRTKAATTAAAPESASTSAKKPSLRIEVLYASGQDEHPSGLAVGVANLSGSIHQPRQVGPNEFLLVEEPPGVYVIAAKAEGFRTSIVRAQLSANAPESKATITLSPERSVRVGWSSPDGRPIRESLVDGQFDEQGVCLLEVLATRFRPSEEPATRSTPLSHLGRMFQLQEDPDGVRRVAATDTAEPNDRRDPPDTLGYLKIDEEGPLWVSAYCNAEWIASEPLDPTAREIVFVTSLTEMVRPTGAVKVRVVDEATGEPIEGASIHFDYELFVVTNTAADGTCEAKGLPPGAHELTVRAGGFLEARAQVTVQAGPTTDAGTIRLEKGLLFAYFRVVDQNGQACSGPRFDLVELEDSPPANRPRARFGASCDVPRRAGETNPKANLRFLGINPVRYLLRCQSSGVDAAPRVVQPEELMRSGKTGVIAEIVVRPAVTARFVLDPPIAKWTQVILESSTGEPLRELAVDLFGEAATDILAGTYRLHLVEYGRATEVVEVSIDSDPFVFQIHR